VFIPFKADDMNIKPFGLGKFTGMKIDTSDFGINAADA
jgi:hypothetical protein